MLLSRGGKNSLTDALGGQGTGTGCQASGGTQGQQVEGAPEASSHLGQGCPLASLSCARYPLHGGIFRCPRSRPPASPGHTKIRTNSLPPDPSCWGSQCPRPLERSSRDLVAESGGVLHPGGRGSEVRAPRAASLQGLWGDPCLPSPHLAAARAPSSLFRLPRSDLCLHHPLSSHRPSCLHGYKDPRGHMSTRSSRTTSRPKSLDLILSTESLLPHEVTGLGCGPFGGHYSADRGL